jgi:hypothetical protein
MQPIEIWGYISMIVVVVSMLMKNIKKLRLLNTVACSMFVIYGVVLNAYPIVIMNLIVIGINIFRLIKGE